METISATEVLSMQIKTDVSKRIIFRKSKIVGKCSREILDKRVLMAATLQAEGYLKKLNRGILLDKDEIKSLAILHHIAISQPILNEINKKQNELEQTRYLLPGKPNNNEIVKESIFKKLVGARSNASA